MPSKYCDPAQFQLLADLGRQLGDGLFDRLVADLGRLERVDVSGLRCQRRAQDLIGEFLELGVLGDEVGLGVQLDERPPASRHQAFGSGPLGTLADVLGALDPQRLDGFVEIAVGLGQRVLAGHHPGAGEIPEPLDVGGGVVRHISLPGGLQW